MRRVLFLVVMLVLAVPAALAPLSAVGANQAATPAVLAPIQHVGVGDLTVGYRAGGSGFPLVLVMGRGGTMAAWDPKLLAVLMTRHRVIVFDNRGMGTTANPSSQPLTVAQMATDTIGLMQALGIHQADLLGWSMGGYIAQTVALQQPTLIRHLVLAATDPGGAQTIPPASRYAAALDNPGLTLAQLLRFSFPHDAAGTLAAAAYLKRVLTQPGLTPASFTVTAAAKANQAAATAHWKAAAGGDYAQLPHIHQPTLVADGAADLIVPIANAQLLADRIPGAKLLVYPDAGHAFLFQDAARFGAAVLSFLAG